MRGGGFRSAALFRSPFLPPLSFLNPANASDSTRTMGYTDLHCHWVAGVDDGAASAAQGLAILRGLRKLGFRRVIATPHMRPGLFDNTRGGLERAYEAAEHGLRAEQGLPALGLSCEHYLDDVVYDRIVNGGALPYPGGRSILLELYDSEFSGRLEVTLAHVRRQGLIPVIAHPERYRALWGRPGQLERVLDVGAAALLDIAALAGHYGNRPRRAAREFLELGLYTAACSDAHRAADLGPVSAGMQWVVERYGQGELQGLLSDGPSEILAGTA